MIDQYRVELDPPALPLGPGSTGPGVKRAQEWLGLCGHAVDIDGDFGPATARAITAFQAERQIAATGTVDGATWDQLAHNLQAVGQAAVSGVNFGDAAAIHAADHLQRRSREVGGDNCGPWVRHYCRGQQVAWCQGFASTMWADAARRRGEALPLELVLDGIWCLFVPRMVAEAKARGRFILGDHPHAGLELTRGSMFFLRGGEFGYRHVGLVDEVHADGTMTTIEGNTNEDGSANGYEVARRTRQIASCDFGRA